MDVFNDIIELLNTLAVIRTCCSCRRPILSYVSRKVLLVTLVIFSVQLFKRLSRTSVSLLRL